MQIGQEARALLTGQIGPDAQVARSLGITGDQIKSAIKAGTLFEFLETKMGAFNTAADLGFAFGGFASLEAIVAEKPDLLLVSQAGDFAGDDGQAFLLHPALARIYPAEKRIVIPESPTECGGGMLAEALAPEILKLTAKR